MRTLQRSAGALAAVLLTVAGCDCGDPDLGRTLPAGARIDLFQQADRSVIDILWVIDNSPTMRDVQDNLGQNLVSFFRYLDSGDVDYQIGVTTTDILRHGGSFVGSPQIITPDTPDTLRVFRGNVHVGTDGSAREEGLAAAELLFQHQPGFLREDAYVFIVFVSDQDDRSFGEIHYFWRVFSLLQGVGNENKVSVAAIVGTDEPLEPGSPFHGCVTDEGSAEAGLRYIELVELTGGIWGSICDDSFASTLEGMGANAVGLRRKFRLSEVPDLEETDVNVYYPCEDRPEEIGLCDEIIDTCDARREEEREFLCVPPRGGPDGWIYEAETQSIFFQGLSVPGLKAAIEVVYLPEREGLER
ncbi:MAG: hypothetical protein ACOC0J_00205 [Myxococcota bacterium]